VNKKAIITVVVLLLLALGGYAVMSWKTTPVKKISEASPTETISEKAPASESLKDLLSSGKSQTCTFTTNSEDYSGSGTVYVGGEMMRGDFTTMVSGAEMKSHMIVKDKTSYIWTEGQKQGIKTTFEDQNVSEDLTGTPAQTGQKGPDVNAEYSYDCKDWTIDPSMLELPAGVVFASVTEMIGGGSPAAGGQCAVCDSLEGEQKTQCLTALKCS
jgi:hypothetical protein